MGPGVLDGILKSLPKSGDPNLLIGFETGDDAAVYKLTDELAVIETVDFFPPMVDDPYLFGQIAATNALSDVYAMGGTPKLALNLLCVPTDKLPRDAIEAILAGGASKVTESGASLCGGHTIEDKEPKYGLAVTGIVHPGHILANNAAREGDVLILTKPLGSGILTTAAKVELTSDAAFREMADTMTTLNASAQKAMLGLAVHACTDVTGFGLLGHAAEMAAGGTTLRFDHRAIPAMESAPEFARMGIIPAGCHRNRVHVGDNVKIAESVPLEVSDLMFDPQTAGGLLISVAEKDAKTLLRRLGDVLPKPRLVGRVEARGSTALIVE